MRGNAGVDVQPDKALMRFEVTRSITNTVSTLARFAVLAGIVALGAGGGAVQAKSVRIEHKIAIFSTLDKVTARISKIEIPLNETVQFGSLRVTPRVCYSRPATERPKTTSFVEVYEVQLDGQEEKVFSGWMFAESPGLNAVEHPVFDVWLTDCAGGAQPAQAAGASGSEAEGVRDAAPRPVRRRRVRR